MSFNVLDDVTVMVYDHPEDRHQDRLLCAEIGRILVDHYPGWGWYVDIPPKQNVVIIRNLTCDPRGRMGFVKHKDKINMGALRREVCLAAGAFLEHYEYLKGHAGRFRPDDLNGREMLFEKPQN